MYIIYLNFLTQYVLIAYMQQDLHNVSLKSQQLVYIYLAGYINNNKYYQVICDCSTLDQI
jgi:hypothetical protein